MCVIPVLPVVFKPSKIELEKIHKQDLANYNNLKQLAEKNFCDILIEKNNTKSIPDFNVYRVLARRRWINPQYVFGDYIITLHKNTPLKEVSEKIYDASVKATRITKEKTRQLARKFIKR